MRVVCSFLSVLLIVASGCGDTPAPDGPPRFELAEKEFEAVEGLILAGQPSQARIAEIAAAEYTLVVSINPPKKAPTYDEAAAVEAAGMAYKHIPLSKTTVLDAKAREAAYAVFDEIAADGTKTYLHCSTSNRCGALWALYQAERKKLPAEKALEEGKRVGLTKLEPEVRKLLGLPAK